MKKVRADIDQWLDRLDKNWDAMPLRKQHQIIVYFFAAYAFLTAVVLFNVYADTAGKRNTLDVEHIEKHDPAGIYTPPQMKDSLKPILKK